MADSDSQTKYIHRKGAGTIHKPLYPGRADVDKRLVQYKHATPGSTAATITQPAQKQQQTAQLGDVMRQSEAGRSVM